MPSLLAMNAPRFPTMIPLNTIAQAVRRPSVKRAEDRKQERPRVVHEQKARQFGSALPADIREERLPNHLFDDLEQVAAGCHQRDPDEDPDHEQASGEANVAAVLVPRVRRLARWIATGGAVTLALEFVRS